MWFLYAAEQTGSGLDWTAVSTVLAAIIALGGGLVTVFVTVRTSSRSEETKREADLDDRVDAEVERLGRENAALRAETASLRMDRDRFWSERNAALEREVMFRRYIREHGGNPDEVIAHG